MNIVLPSEMQQTIKMESSPNTFIYVFVTKSVNKESGIESQLKIVSIDKAPTKETENEAWQTDILGRQIALWRESFPLSLESQHHVFSQRPQTETIGKYSYKTIDMSFDTMDTKFLNVIYNQATYMFTLVSLGKDKKLRKENMEKMINQLKTVELKNIHSS